MPDKPLAAAKPLIFTSSPPVQARPVADAVRRSMSNHTEPAGSSSIATHKVTPEEPVGRSAAHNEAAAARSTQPDEASVAAEGSPYAEQVLMGSSLAPTAPPPPPTGLVKDDSTNLRAGPGTSYRKIVKLNQGDVVTLRQHYRGWFKATAPDGSDGWVSANLLTFAEGVTDQVPAALNVPAVPTASATQTDTPTKTPIAGGAAQQPADVRLKSEPTLVALTADQTQRSTPDKRWLWPTDGNITSGFGYRDFSVGQFHNGIDIANSRGTPIVAARDGVVTEAGWCSGYGYCVKIDHGDGFLTEYGHLAWRPPVQTGEAIAAGDLIGYMGMTFDRSGGGYATGVHLHFTIRLNGTAVNPLRYLP